MRKAIAGDDNILNIVNEIEAFTSEDKTFDDILKVFPDQIENLEEALNNYRSENDPKILPTEFPDKESYSGKNSAYPYEYFNSINEYQKPGNNLKKEDLFCKSGKYLSQ